MASEIRAFSPTIPAGTAQAAGWSSDLSFPPRVVERLDILVPAGPRGTVGFYIGTAGTQVVPLNVGQYIVTDDERLSFDLTGQINSGSWTFYGYNLGRKNHTIYVRFSLSLPYGPDAGPPSSLIPNPVLTFGTS